MVLHLNPALQANPPAGVPCILGWGLDCARASYQPLHQDQRGTLMLGQDSCVPMRPMVGRGWPLWVLENSSIMVIHL